jgi:hypothetical protein
VYLSAADLEAALVTEPDSLLLDRTQLKLTFVALGERLVRRGV